MLIPFSELITTYGIQPTGVLHIGASTGQEAPAYFAAGIRNMLFIEAIPEVYQELLNNISMYPGARAINACISEIDGEERDFNISSNGGESSSLLPFGLHAEMHPDVTYIKTIRVITTRMDTLLRQEKVDLLNYNFLNIDLQGAELMALKSMAEHLQRIRYAYIEVNKKELYKGCPLVYDIDAYMACFGFIRKAERWTDKFWGDAFYIKP